MQVKIPQRRDNSPLTKLFGIGKIVGGIYSGGAGYMAIPSGIKDIQGRGGGDTQIPNTSNKYNVRSPGQKQDAMGKLATMGNIVQTGMGVYDKIQNANTKPEYDPKNITQEQALKLLKEGETIINELNDPEIAMAYKPFLFKSMLVAKNRLRLGQEPYQYEGGTNASSYA